MTYEFREPIITQVNDHIWLLDDNHEATMYLVAGTERAMVIDTSIGLCNVREVAEKLTDLPLIEGLCKNDYLH